MKPTHPRRRPIPFRLGTFAPPVIGVLDARTAEERAADEAAGRTWEQVAADHLAGLLERLEPKAKPAPKPSRN